ncbi:MAG: LppX_LprAFG lipoprotein [Chloroflexi bacterium]|nr:LppX_LprAFG lipoprotein [Chloroflexota bacterium]
MKSRIVLIILAALLAGAGLSQAQEAEAAAPQLLLNDAVAQLQSAESFRLAIEQRGQPYQLSLSFDGVNMLRATLEGADAQAISPDELYISARLRLIIPLTMDIYARADRQWLSFPGGAPWIALPAFEGFDVSRLLAPGDGIEKVMTDLREPTIAAAALVDEQPAWHIKATAAGDAVAGLLFGFIDPIDDVEIDAYLTVEDGRLALIEILMLETARDPEAAPSVWRIRFYDYDAPRGFNPPAA